MQTITRLMCGVSLLCAVTAGEVQARPRTVVVGDGVRMKVEVPAGYAFKSETGLDGQHLIMLDNPVWPILITVAVASPSLVDASTDEKQRNVLVTQTADILAESREQDYNFVPLEPVVGSGVYCVFSHPGAGRADDLMPNQFLHVVAGIKAIRGAVMYFKIKTNALTSPEYEEALGLFVSSFDGA